MTKKKEFTLSEVEGLENSAQAHQKTTQSHSDSKTVMLSGVEAHADASLSMGRGIKGEGQSPNYNKALTWLEEQGKKHYGQQFLLSPPDLPVIRKLIAYFLRDELAADLYNINLHKGILLTGPIGCGKTSLLNLMRFLQPVENRFIIRSSRDVSFEFIEHGYSTISKYSIHSFKNFNPLTYCFDDLGVENSLKFFGNECNIMAEILLSRYDQFISRQLITHITTNLSATEIETLYGNRVRSRMREMLNLISFDKNTKDKRK